MTEEVKDTETMQEPQVEAPQAEAPAEPPQEGNKTLTLDDIQTIQQLRDLHSSTDTGLTNWARKRIQETNYLQAVQTELAIHKGDAHGFVIAALMNFIEAQDKRIDVLENLLIKAIKNAKDN